MIRSLRFDRLGKLILNKKFQDIIKPNKKEGLFKLKTQRKLSTMSRLITPNCPTKGKIQTGKNKEKERKLYKIKQWTCEERYVQTASVGNAIGHTKQGVCWRKRSLCILYKHNKQSLYNKTLE
uniref:Uncharacterized protein MANES_04G036000 n=1 Tax=Rhizophora mucronata TaxID=61149 RepID=A0A2P2JJ92_RHIMU